MSDFTPYTPTAAASAPPAGGATGVPATPTMSTVSSTPATPSSSFIPYTPGQTAPVPSLPNTPPAAATPSGPTPLTNTGLNAPSGSNPLGDLVSNFASDISQIPTDVENATAATTNRVKANFAAAAPISTRLGRAQRIGALVQGLYQAVGNVGSGVGQAISTVPEATGQTIGENSKTEQAVATSPLANTVVDTVHPAIQLMSDWAKKYPNAAADLNTTSQLAMYALGSPQLSEALETARSAASSIPEATSDSIFGQTIQNTKDAFSAAQSEARTQANDNAVTSKTGAALQAIADKITPNPTAGEAKAAMVSGRLFKGTQGGLVSEGIPDQVANSPEQGEQARTIFKLIPGAEEMDDPTLYTALNEGISDSAQMLRPIMDATPIKPSIIQQINDAWSALKPKQIEEADATDEPNVAKWQQNFEKYLLKSGSSNMGDLWDTAQAYDRSIKANVKNATDMSPHSLQTQKDIWLQNRAILKSAINSTKDGLGKISGNAFADMHNMYNAQESLLSKAKINLEGAPSRLSQFLETPTGKVMKYGAGVLGVDKILKGL